MEDVSNKEWRVYDVLSWLHYVAGRLVSTFKSI
jgi:hypothetical protein